ncbi:hypothetical protein POM88_003048 [Heracleum sosnowskyi]|uniref:Uncharacterized protein n=1 Tax=Heracleum sosnowskyi TaxID=360622 RepID=A0AAD8ND44_9APIA|nr:hypothetical protein POM88_003048 [Heracleum sosnowskyi]
MFRDLSASICPVEPRLASLFFSLSYHINTIANKASRREEKEKELFGPCHDILTLAGACILDTLEQVKRSLVIALSPVLDNTKTVSLISLPGAMTGLIMGGASPVEAIQLQIVVMNMLMGLQLLTASCLRICVGLPSSPKLTS